MITGSLITFSVNVAQVGNNPGDREGKYTSWNSRQN